MKILAWMFLLVVGYAIPTAVAAQGWDGGMGFGYGWAPINGATNVGVVTGPIRYRGGSIYSSRISAFGFGVTDDRSTGYGFGAIAEERVAVSSSLFVSGGGGAMLFRTRNRRNGLVASGPGVMLMASPVTWHSADGRWEIGPDAMLLFLSDEIHPGGFLSVTFYSGGLHL